MTHLRREERYVVAFAEIDGARIALVGGKGARLGELARIRGVSVPDGFCVTTCAFERALSHAPQIAEKLERLSRMSADDRSGTAALAAEIRSAIEGLKIPDDVAREIGAAVRELGERTACAVRSSATAEDLPTASFAGQHDTYLNVVGQDAILRHVRACWSSLYTESAVSYRLRSGIDQREMQMAVVVQRMVDAEVSGVLFTADPATSNRRVASIEAVLGLGEALVSGRAAADVFTVRDGAVIARTIATKSLALHAEAAGGTREQPVAPSSQQSPALTDEQIARLDRLGRLIEARLGGPQDIEWCLAGDELYVVQSRPITTLFPVPKANDADNHVYVSVGHQQMMTDAMRPLGYSMWQLMALRPMVEAGGRLFVDVTRELASPVTRSRMVDAFTSSDPLIGDAFATLLSRDGFLPPAEAEAPAIPAGLEAPEPIANDRAIVSGLIERTEGSLGALELAIHAGSGPALLDFILADMGELKHLLIDPLSMQAIMAGMEATAWLNSHIEEWLREKNVADTLTQSNPDNVTSEMGLALLDVADVIRAHPRVVAFLESAMDEGFLDELSALDGGRESRDAIQAYLGRYGMRCVGEIDITRPRWAERPTTLLPMLLSDVKNFDAGAGKRLFEQGRREALEKERELLARLRALPDGEQKADETARMVDRVRTFVGYREYPKYGIVRRLFVYKQALLRQAESLVKAGVLGAAEDIFYLTFQELQEVVRTGRADAELIGERMAAFRANQALTPPRVLTSEGEVVAGRYRRDDIPPDALVGLPVSAGAVEGRARVVFDVEQAEFEPGDILVTPYTDPSWSPVFVVVSGLVTEVGGLMTHGSVIAREYGLPAVVNVVGATRLIADGRRIRIDGTRGYVEILDDAGAVAWPAGAELAS